MSKVQGPLMSLRGTGTLGRTLTYQGRPSGTAVFLSKTPYDPKTISQLNIRAYVALGVTYWQTMGAPYHALWRAFVT